MKTKGKAGGGANSRQVRNVGVKTGPNAKSTTKINPCGVAQLGTHVGEVRAVEKIQAGAAPQVPLGNTVALNVNGGGPGKGRQLYGQSGTQKQTGINGSPRPPAEPWFKGFPGD